jgi:uncharacterized protein YdhG (YjbR/CyaY superfamily)
MARAKTVDEYLARLSADKRAALQRVRKAVHVAAPGVEECISYGIPGFRLGGRMLVWMGAASRHCSFFPGGIVQAYKADLEGYETGKGTIRFTPAHPLPAALVRKLVKARIAQQAKAAPRGRRKAVKPRARAR